MTDGNTYAINKHLDDQEDFDALQEVTAELEQAEAETKKYHDAWLAAEAKVVELELAVRYEADLAQQALDTRKELEAKLKSKEKLVLDLAGDKINLVAELADVKVKLAKALELAEEALYFNDDGNDLAGWRSALWRIKELKGQDYA